MPKDYFSRQHFQEDFPLLVFCFFSWCMYYMLIKYHLFKGKMTINGKLQTDDEHLTLINAFPAATHGLVSFIYGAYHYFYFNPPECGMMNNQLQRQCLMFSISYFFYDTFCMLFEKTIDRFIVIHHFFSILGLWIPYIENQNGIYSMVGIFVTEVSNPAMYIKNFLRMFGKRWTFAYECGELLFLSMYFLGRAILSWGYVYRSVTC